MSYIKIWIHCVWTTKDRTPYLKDGIKDKVILHILENAKHLGIYIEKLNGHHEHLHALISLGSSQNISDLMQQIKGESSFWINKNKLTRLKFEWQDDYYAVSVGMDHFENLRLYIGNQAKHHQKDSLKEELDSLIREYKMEKFAD